jgi:hypothetical protein
MDNRSQSLSNVAPSDEARAQEIRAEIEQTREDLSETVEAIQEKLRPSNIVANAATATTERVKDMASNAADTAGEWWEASGGDGIVGRIRNHPLPALMTGIGLAWLALSDGGRRQYGYQPNRAERSPQANRYRSDYSTDQWSESSRGVMQSAADMAKRSNRTLRRGRNNLELMIREYPLAVGAAAAVLGATLGMVLPETARENELFGEARESAAEHVQQVAANTAARVKEAATDAVAQTLTGG